MDDLIRDKILDKIYALRRLHEEALKGDRPSKDAVWFGSFNWEMTTHDMRGIIKVLEWSLEEGM